MSAQWEIFVSCAPGLQMLLAQEIADLGFEAAAVEPAGVALLGDTTAIMRLNLHLALGAHVLIRVGTFEARHFSALVKRAARLPWPSLLPTDCGWTVRATCRRSKLYHSDAVAQRIDTAIAHSLGRPGSDATGGPRVAIVVRMDRDQCHVSLDTSGDPLHRRGWRKQTAKAPMREDLAHALVVAAQWEGTTPFIDPFAGSGTLAIEAACLARRLAPGRLRGFSFQHTRLMDASLWARVVAAAQAQVRPTAPPIVGRDRVGGAINAAQGNAERAGVAADIRWELADLEQAPLPDLAGATLVTNPPYGHRVTGAAAAHNALASRLAQSCVARVALVAPTDATIKLPGVALRKYLMTDHGGTKVDFWAGERHDPHAPPQVSIDA